MNVVERPSSLLVSRTFHWPDLAEIPWKELFGMQYTNHHHMDKHQRIPGNLPFDDCWYLSICSIITLIVTMPSVTWSVMKMLARTRKGVWGGLFCSDGPGWHCLSKGEKMDSLSELVMYLCPRVSCQLSAALSSCKTEVSHKDIAWRNRKT